MFTLLFVAFVVCVFLCGRDLNPSLEKILYIQGDDPKEQTKEPNKEQTKEPNKNKSVEETSPNVEDDQPDLGGIEMDDDSDDIMNQLEDIEERHQSPNRRYSPNRRHRGIGSSDVGSSLTGRPSRNQVPHIKDISHSSTDLNKNRVTPSVNRKSKDVSPEANSMLNTINGR